MSPTMQRGYDDQMGPGINADLFCADTDEAREYRAGSRAARRELMWASGTHVVKGWDLATQPDIGVAQRVDMTNVIGIATHDSTPAPDGNGHLVRVNITPPIPVVATVVGAPNAFEDPAPKKKPRRTKASDTDQLGLF